MDTTLKSQALAQARPVDTGARLGTALLAYMLGVTLIVTLLPFHFEWPHQWVLTLGGDPYDLMVGVLLFVPLGFLFRLAMTRERRGATLFLLWNAALISGVIEAMQLFDATRESTLLDVVANTSGAWLGACAFDAIARSAKLSGRIIGWLSLEIPLMGLVYLLVPLLWMNSLAGRGEGLPTIGTMLIGAFGAVILGGLQRHYFGISRAAEAHHTAAAAALWFLAGALAMMPWQPAMLFTGALGVAGLCWFQGRRTVHTDCGNRRFEAPLLRSAAPFYTAYLVLLVVWPVVNAAGSWNAHLGFPQAAPSRLETAQLLELCIASTLVGYMGAEIRGREIMRYRDALPRLIKWGFTLALAAEAARGFSLYGASMARAVLVMGACLYGGWLYDLQRAHVISLVSKKRADYPAGN